VRILMIAPEPFFEPRGTPFSEFHRIRALTALGHEVDLVTYPIGQDVTMPGLRVFRCLRPPFVHHVKVGPSPAKVVLDALLTFTVLRRAVSARYDVVHSHEEARLIGSALAMILRVPHLYDMHSSLPQQLTNCVQPIARHAADVPGDRAVHDPPLARGDRICPALEGRSARRTARADCAHRERARIGEDPADAADAAGVRTALGLNTSTPMVLYTGVRGVSGSRPCCSRRWPSCIARGRRSPCSRAGSPIGCASAGSGARARRRGHHTLLPAKRPASKPGYLLASDAGLATIAWHETHR
jgi:hypothetical protein